MIGGAEIFGTNLVSALQDRGHDIIVVTSKDLSELPPEIRYKGIPIYQFPFREALSGREIDQVIACRHGIANLKRTFQPDLIYLNGVGPSTLFHLQTTGIQPTPVLVRMNQEVFSSVGAGSNTLMHKMLKNASWITSVSQEIHRQVCQWVPEVRSRSSVIYTGLQKPLQSLTPLPFDPPMLVCLGRLVHQKGFDLALTAFISIHQRFSNIRMVIAGDGPERPKLEQQVAELGLGELVKFVGWVESSKVYTLLNFATMVLIPSRHEGLPQVACQAAMMGRPIVATRVAGLPEIVQHKETGLLVEKEDTHALTEAILYLLQHPDTAIQMGHAAQDRSTEKFHWESCVTGFEAQCKKLVKKGSKKDSHVTYL